MKEGCPCCLTAVDLDELIGFFEAFNSHNAALLCTPDYTSAGKVTIKLLIGMLATLGFTASYRNINGTKSNLKKFDRLINSIKNCVEHPHFQNSELIIETDKILLNRLWRKLHKQNPVTTSSNDTLLSNLNLAKDEMKALMTYVDILETSIDDSIFNKDVPGWTNLLTSTSIASLLLSQHMMSLIPLTIYLGLQTRQNIKFAKKSQENLSSAPKKTNKIYQDFHIQKRNWTLLNALFAGISMLSGLTLLGLHFYTISQGNDNNDGNSDKPISCWPPVRSYVNSNSSNMTSSTDIPDQIDPDLIPAILFGIGIIGFSVLNNFVPSSSWYKPESLSTYKFLFRNEMKTYKQI